MSDDISGQKLTRRHLLGGIAMTGVAAAGAGAGTMAYFQDTETSNGNTIDAGTLDLKLGDGDETAGDSTSDGVTGTLNASNFVPGNYVSGTVEATNAGSIAADHVEVNFQASGTEAFGNGNDEADTLPDSASRMPELFRVVTLSYPEGGSSGSSNLKDQVNDHNNNGITDLDDVVQHGVFDTLEPAPQAGGTKSLTMEFEFISPETNGDYTGSLNDDDFQGDDLSITVTMALAQESSQNIL